MISVSLLAGLLATEAVAAPVANTAPQTTVSTPRQTPLTPAGAAPIREAQGVGRPLLYWAAAGAVIVAGVLLIYEGNDEDTSTTTTTTTGTN